MELTTRVDDVDASVDAVQHTIALAGRTVQVDISPANFDKIVEVLKPYLDAGSKPAGEAAPARKAPKLTRPAHPVVPPSTANGNGNGKASRGDLDAIRAWASSQGIEVAPRGRIAKAVQEQYDAAQGTAPKGKEGPTAQEILDLHKQLGTFTQLAEALGVSTATATKRFRAAQDALDPVS